MLSRLSDFKHGTIEQGAIGLHGIFTCAGTCARNEVDEFGQPFHPGEQRLPAVQDDVDIGSWLLGVLGDAFHGRRRPRPLMRFGRPRHA